MGAACCRCQQVAFEDDALRFPTPVASRRTASRVAAQDGESAAASLLSRAAGSSSASSSLRSRHHARARRPSRQSVTMNHSLANYVAFPFPFATKAPAKRATKTKSLAKSFTSSSNKTLTKKKSAASAVAAMTVLEMVPSGLGAHYSKNCEGEMTPLSLVELCVRRVCASLVADPVCYSHTWPTSRRACIPSEVASAVVVYLKSHEVLTKDHFRFLARYMFQEWNLKDQLEVDSSWFNNIGVAPLQYIKSIDFTNCPNLVSLGSDRWLQVDEMPNLTSASFRNCDKLTKCVPDILQSSTRLTSLNFAGCRNIDDRSLLALRRLFRLRMLDLSGCHQVTDEGFKCLTSLSKMEELVLTRCTKLTDQAFEDIELAFPVLHHLDVAYCCISDVSLAHFGHVVSLTTLIVRGCRQITDTGIERLASLKGLKHFDARHCEDIRTLRAEWSDMRVLLLSRSSFAESEAAVLRNMGRIVELDMKACRILKRGFEFVSKLVHVKRLALAETALTDSALIQICKGIRGLVALNVSHTEITDSGTEGLSYLLDLEELRMDTAGITNRSLVNVSGLKKLCHLDLFGTSVSDNGLLHITGLRELRVLEICSGSITDRGVELISRLKSLRTLNLSQNRHINTKGVQHLRSLTELKHLNLSSTAVSADSFRHLQALNELESLSIYGCELTSAQVEMLQELLPKLRCLRCS